MASQHENEIAELLRSLPDRTAQLLAGLLQNAASPLSGNVQGFVGAMSPLSSSFAVIERAMEAVPKLTAALDNLFGKGRERREAAALTKFKEATRTEEAAEDVAETPELPPVPELPVPAPQPEPIPPPRPDLPVDVYGRPSLPEMEASAPPTPEPESPFPFAPKYARPVPESPFLSWEEVVRQREAAAPQPVPELPSPVPSIPPSAPMPLPEAVEPPTRAPLPEAVEPPSAPAPSILFRGLSADDFPPPPPAVPSLFERHLRPPPELPEPPRFDPSDPEWQAHEAAREDEIERRHLEESGAGWKRTRPTMLAGPDAEPFPLPDVPEMPRLPEGEAEVAAGVTAAEPSREEWRDFDDAIDKMKEVATGLEKVVEALKGVPSGEVGAAAGGAPEVGRAAAAFGELPPVKATPPENGTGDADALMQTVKILELLA